MSGESFLRRIKHRFQKAAKHEPPPERLHYPGNTVSVVPGYYGNGIKDGVPFPHAQVSSPYYPYYPPPARTPGTNYATDYAGYPSPAWGSFSQHSISQIQLPYYQYQRGPPPNTPQDAVPSLQGPSHPPRRRNISAPQFQSVHEEPAEGAYYRRNTPSIVYSKSKGKPRRDDRDRGHKKRGQRERDESRVPAQPVRETKPGDSKKYGLSYAGYPVELDSGNALEIWWDGHPQP